MRLETKRKDKKMINIIRSLNYTTRRSILAVLTVFSMIVIPILFSMFSMKLEGGFSFKDLDGGMYMAAISGNVIILFVIAILIFSTLIVGSDAGDKTINYELMNGHSRSRVFWARIICGYRWAVLLVMLLFFLPFVYFTLINGWGLSVDKVEAAKRLILLIFPIIRICSLFMMITSISRSAGRGAAVSYLAMMVIVMAGSILEDGFGIDTTNIFATSDIAWIMTSENGRNVVINGHKVVKMDYAVSSGKMIQTIVVSLVVSAVYLTIAYIVFKKKDRD